MGGSRAVGGRCRRPLVRTLAWPLPLSAALADHPSSLDWSIRDPLNWAMGGLGGWALSLQRRTGALPVPATCRPVTAREMCCCLCARKLPAQRPRALSLAALAAPNAPLGSTFPSLTRQAAMPRTLDQTSNLHYPHTARRARH